MPILAIARPALLRVSRPGLRYLALYGVVLAMFNAMWTLSVAYNGAAVATVLAYCSAAFTALLGWWLLQERLDWGKIVAVVLSLGGCVLVAGALDPAAWRMNPLGIVTGVLSGLGYAGYSLMGRSASQRGLSPWTTEVYAFALRRHLLLVANLAPVGLPGGAFGPPTCSGWAPACPDGASSSCWRPGRPSPGSGSTTSAWCTFPPASPT